MTTSEPSLDQKTQLFAANLQYLVAFAAAAEMNRNSSSATKPAKGREPDGAGELPSHEPKGD